MGVSWSPSNFQRSPFRSSNRELENLERSIRLKSTSNPEYERPKKRIFISYRYQDSESVNDFQVKAQENSKSPYQFDDMSLNTPIDSKNAEYVKEGIRKRIRRSSVVLVAVSDTSYQSKWIDWEIREALKMGKKVVAFKLTEDPKIPDALRENNINVLPNDQEKISRAIGD